MLISESKKDILYLKSNSMIHKLLLLFILTLHLSAHQTGLSFINIIEDENKLLHITYKKPLSDTRGEDISINYPTHCQVQSKEPQRLENGFIINKSTMWCSNEGIRGSRIWVKGLVSSDRGVLLRYEKDESAVKYLLRSTTPFALIDYTSSKFELLNQYLQLGVTHILGGYDHLLFVLSLLLLATNTKVLLYSITAFTLAHSITLAFGIFDLVSIPIVFVESMIALSIIFLARELLSKEKTYTKKNLAIVAFIFGLLHGFGFSSVLKDIGLPHNEIALSLFSFNLGIELGQILFILSVSATVFLLKRYIKDLTKIQNLKIYLIYFIGAISSYWFIQRVLSF